MPPYSFREYFEEQFPHNQNRNKLNCLESATLITASVLTRML
jgi:hypothetical protein